MFKIKDEKIAKLIEQSAVPYGEFEALLGQACQPISSPKASKTKVVRPADDCTETDTR